MMGKGSVAKKKKRSRYSTHSRWTVAEDGYLFDHMDKMSHKELAAELGRSAYAVKNRIYLLKGAPGSREQPCWTCKRSAAPRGVQCSWDARGEPVEGWEAEEYERNYGDVGYRILRCPEYVREGKT